ncbi:MAG: hypothetical protein N3J91_15445 [Verrucomicrobiae bacterium]|nr:hypothetical protein [Verrucomicrobiae bacterium]
MKTTLRYACLSLLLLLGLGAVAAENERPAQPVPPPPPPPAEGGPELRPERRGPVPGRREAAEMEDRLRRLDAEIKELRRVGDHEAADRLERQRQQMRERLALEREPRDVLAPMAPDEGGPRPPMEPERRQQMVREAVQILRRAGYPELADLVAREVRALGDRGGLDRPREPWGGGPQDDPGPGAAERTERLERAVMEMQRVLREMDRRLRALER